MNILDKVIEIEQKAAAFGFKWSDAAQILAQIRSECKEVEEAIAGTDKVHLQYEIGDLIHAAMCLCVFYNFPVEKTLENSVAKLDKRLRELMRLANEDGYKSLDGQPLEKLMEFWDVAKKNVG